MMASVTLSLQSPPVTSFLLLSSAPRPLSFSSHNKPFTPPPSLASAAVLRRPLSPLRPRLARASALPSEIPPAVADDGVSSRVISALLFVAFVGLSVLTIGVIYLVVQDFLQKREKDKFEKEEAAKQKKGGKKSKVKARAGPRGFGQKVEEFDD